MACNKPALPRTHRNTQRTLIHTCCPVPNLTSPCSAWNWMACRVRSASSTLRPTARTATERGCTAGQRVKGVCSGHRFVRAHTMTAIVMSLVLANRHLRNGRRPPYACCTYVGTNRTPATGQVVGDVLQHPRVAITNYTHTPPAKLIHKPLIHVPFLIHPRWAGC